MKHTTYIIGCGGVGSWLVPLLARLNKQIEHTLHLFDGDSFEEKNLDRQMFDRNNIGRNKAAVLAGMYGCDHTSSYLSPGWLNDIDEQDWVIVCADNNPARRAALNICDSAGARCIVAANEYTDSEAYFYNPATDMNTGNDPRFKYPLLLSDDSDDPLRAGSGCTGPAAAASPQLVIANVSAAVMAADLYWWHNNYADEFSSETHPVHHKKNQFKYTTLKRA